MRWPRALSIAVVVAVASSLAAWSAPSVQVNAQISPTRIGLNELVTFTITARAQGFGGIDLHPGFKLDNLEAVAGPFRSDQVRFVNGFTSRSISLTWQLHPLHPGPARVKSIVVKARGRQIEIPDQTIDVENTATLHPGAAQNQSLSPFGALMQPFSAPSSPFAAPASPPQTMPGVFLQAVANPQNPYVGQQVLYTLYLYTQGDVDNIDPQEIPDFHGFWVKEIPQPTHLQPDMVAVHGQQFGRVVLLQRALFPLHSGALTIGAAKARLTLSVPGEGGFGGLFERTVEVRRQVQPLSISVRALPAPPADFNGAVGALSIHASLTPRQIKVGDAATLTLTLAGFGHVQGLSAPSLPSLPGLESFAPQSESNTKLIGTRVRESATWTYVLVPQKSAHWTLPPVTIPYFDPQTASYAKATTPALELTAVPAPPPAPAPTRPTVSGPNEGSAQPRRGVMGALWAHPWEWGGLIVALLVAAGAVAILGRHNWGRRNPQQSEIAQRYLERISGITLGASPRRTANALDELWREFLDEKWAVPMGTPSARWGALLRRRGVEAETTNELSQLAEDLHFLRYAPQLSASDELGTELVQRSRKLLRRLA